MANTVCGEKTKKKKRCAERREEEEEENSKMKTLKQCTNSDTSSSSSSSSWSWSDLQIDMLKEIQKKLSYVDYIRFRGVCRNWRKVEDDKGDGELLLPWLFVPRLDRENNFSYDLFEPPLASNDYRLYRDDVTIESSRPINLGDYYNHYHHNICRPNEIWSAMYVDGWLYMAFNGNRYTITYFLLFSIATKASFSLPQFNHPSTDDDTDFALSTSPHSVFLAVSTTPDSPDCVFFAFFKTNEYTRTLAILRHGDTHWTRIEFSITPDEPPVVDAAVFIRGAFYFHLSTQGIAYYDLATHQVLKTGHSSTPLEFTQACTRPALYGLDGQLMFTYYERKSSKFCIWKYDWSNQVWNPLNSLGGRSLYLTGNSLYVVPINYTGVASANKIYVRDKVYLEVIEYTLQGNQLLECNEFISWGFENLNCYTPCVIWVDPPDVLLKFGRG